MFVIKKIIISGIGILLVDEILVYGLVMDFDVFEFNVLICFVFMNSVF